MFVRSKKVGSKFSVQIVKSVREGKKIKQEVIKHIGTAANLDDVERLKSIGKTFLKSIEVCDNQTSVANSYKYIPKGKKIDINDVSAEGILICGIHDIFGKIYRDIGFDKVIKNKRKSSSSQDVLFNTVMARISDPQSKLETSKILLESFGYKVSVDQIYRMMDKLEDKAISKAKELSFESTKLLLGHSNIKVLFYDVTTLYFESFEEDTLKSKGYSKDMKFNQSQVVLSVTVTEHGLPVDYELYEGSKYEGHTLLDAINNIKSKYGTSKITVVADSGMMNKDNLSLIKEAGFQYIIGCRIKNQSKKNEKEILDIDSYSDVSEGFKVKKISGKEGNPDIIVSYSAKRARKDAHDREKSIDKLANKLRKSSDPKSLLSNYGYKKFLTIETNKDTKISVDQKKVEQSKKWDGLHGIITNNKDIDPEEAIGQYKGLWQVEETFRISKTDLKFRPIYHYTPNRIKAHILISYMALVCIRNLEYRIKVQFKKISPSSIVSELKNVYATILSSESQNIKFAIMKKLNNTAKHIYRITSVKKNEKPFYIN